MKRIVLAAISTLAALVLLFAYPTSTGQSGSTAAEPVSAANVINGQPTSTAPTAGAPTTGQGPDPAPSGAAVPTTQAGTASAPLSATIDGAAEMTRYGVVQVRVVIAGGVITDVTAVQYPNTDRTDVQINGRAIPQLRAKVLSAQSAKIDGVSGATFTSDGYLTSLQSALDAAGFQQ